MKKNNIKKEDGSKVNLTVNQINLINVDRTMKVVKDVIHALRSAESVYYPNRVQLYDIYKVLELDGTLMGIVSQRIDAVANKKLRFLCNGESVDGMADFLKSRELRQIVVHIMKSIFWGITGLEFIPGQKLSFVEIPRKHIKPELGIITINQSDYEGIDYKGLSNIFIVGEEKDFGLFLPCSIYSIFKKGTFSDYSQFVEIFGQPVRVGKYDANDLKTKVELNDALQSAGGSLAIMIPKQAEFEMIDGKTSNANGALQKGLIDACNNEMTLCILHNTETSSSTNGGSNAKAQEHGKQQMEVTVSDMALALGWLNTPEFLAILKSYGYPTDGGCFEFEDEVNLNKLSQRLNIDTQVAKQVPIGDDYWYETYHIPKPKDYDTLKKKKEEKAKGLPKKEDVDEGNSEDDRGLMAKLKRLKDSLFDFFYQAHQD